MKGFLVSGFILLTQIISFAQDNRKSIYTANSYSLDLPEQWMKPKWIKLITEILPIVFSELKEGHVSPQGKSAYCVHLFIDSLQFSNKHTSGPFEKGSGPGKVFNYRHSFNYSFYAGLVLLDSLKKPVTILKIIDPRQLHDHSFSVDIRARNAVYEYGATDSSGRRNIIESVPAVATDLPQFNPAAYITREYLIAICEKELIELRKLLKQQVK